MENKKPKIRFKDLSLWLKAAIIGGWLMLLGAMDIVLVYLY